MRGVKFRTLHAFGAWKRSMKLVRIGKKKVAQSIANEGVGASNDVSPALSVQDLDAASVSGVSSASTSATATSVSGLASTSTSGNVSRTIHLETHFLTHEEIEAANRQRADVQNKLGAMPPTQRKFQAMEPDPVRAIAAGEGGKLCLVQMQIILWSLMPKERHASVISWKNDGGGRQCAKTSLAMLEGPFGTENLL